MRVIIDGDKITEYTDTIFNKEKLKNLVLPLIEGNRMIILVKIDGKEYDFSKAIDHNTGKEIKQIEVTTATLREIIFAGLYDAIVLLEYIKKDLKNISELLILGDVEEGMKNFSKVTENFDWIITLIDNIRQTGLTEKIDYQEYEEFISEFNNLNNILKKIESFIKNEDYVMVADIVEYELISLIEKTQEKIPVIYRDIFKDKNALN